MKINISQSSDENFFNLLNQTLSELGKEFSLTKEDVDITSPQEDIHDNYNTTVVITNKLDHNKLSRPINFHYNRVDIIEQLGNKEHPETRNIVQVDDDNWSAMDNDTAEITLSDTLEHLFVINALNFSVEKKTEDRYDITITGKSNTENLLYKGSALFSVIRKDTLV